MKPSRTKQREGFVVCHFVVDIAAEPQTRNNIYNATLYHT